LALVKSTAQLFKAAGLGVIDPANSFGWVEAGYPKIFASTGWQNLTCPTNSLQVKDQKCIAIHDKIQRQYIHQLM
jgi:hypothetical protein